MCRAALIAVTGVLALILAPPQDGSAQDRVQIEKARADAQKRMMEARARAGQPVPAAGNPTPDQANAEKEKGKEAKSEDKKDEPKSDSIKRPDKPPRVPDPRELQAKPDEDGRITFNFYGQGWPDVLQWLANINSYSLDWQELPNDYVNITTTRKYTLDEAHDLFNRLLLERGYTMIRQGRILSVVRISKVDPSLLPRVQDESELQDLPAHDLVKITFKLPDELKADQAATDVKPLLSPHAKVQPLLATNRLLVIDAVVNLREVSQLVNAEHAAATSHIVPREFPVRFARADRVADQVMILLGLDPSSRRTPQELQVEQQRLQLFQQMQQRGKDVTKFLRPGDAPQVYLAVNDRNNSILANAPPAELKTIERAIEHLDVPTGSGVTSALGPFSGEPTMKRYSLVTVSPESIVSALEEIGNLDPRTRLRTDANANVVFANAPPNDHQKIQALIDKLDGSGRELEVIWLRRLPAVAVAETLTKLMVGEKEEKDNNRGSYYGFYGGYSSRSRRDEQKQDQGEFRVDADVERNRLLLWCTQAEHEEVQKFLVKLGEVPGRSGNPNPVRFLDARDPETTARLLEQLRNSWSGSNELKIHLPPQQPAEDESEEQESGDVERPTTDSKSTSTTSGTLYQVAARTSGPPAALPLFDLATYPVADLMNPLAADAPPQPPAPQPPAPQPPAPQPPAPERQDTAGENTRDEITEPDPATATRRPPPISITLTPDGRIMLHSQDTAALDELEDLLNSLAPPTPNFKVYYLKYGYAPFVNTNLNEYFEEDAEFDTEDNWMRAWYGYDFEASDSSGGGLSAQRKIRFIYDIDTNSILVSNASPSQLAIVDQLIEIYDKEPSEDSYSSRAFRIFKLNYSKADAVAKTLKEVFRDLLSSKDKDFEKQQQGQKQGSSGLGTSYVRIYGSGLGGNDDKDKKPSMVKASFEGALSVGIDDISNSVIVSAQEEFMASISQMIEYLDENAKPQTTVQTYEVNGQVNVEALKTALSGILGEAWIGQRQPDIQPPQQPAPQQPALPQQPQFRGNQPAAAPAIQATGGG